MAGRETYNRPVQPNPLDQRLAQLLVQRGVLTPQRAQEALSAAARHPQQHRGSRLVHLLAVHGVLRPADCDRWVQLALASSSEFGRVDLPSAADVTRAGGVGDMTFAPGVEPPEPDGQQTFAPGLSAEPSEPDGQQTFAAGLDPVQPAASGEPDGQQTFAAGLDPAPPAGPAGDLTFVPGGVAPPPPTSAYSASGDMTLLPPSAADASGSGLRPARRTTGHQHAPLDGDATFAGGPLPPTRRHGPPVPQDPNATLLHPADYPAAIGQGPGADEDHTLMAVPQAMSSGFGHSPQGGQRGDTLLEGSTRAHSDQPPSSAPLAGVLVDLFESQRYRLTSVVDPTRLEATDLRLRAPVVVCKPGSALPPEGQQQFLREAYVLAQLDHPAIPRVHDAGVESGEPFFTIEPLEGEVLGRGSASPQELLRAFVNVAGAVEHAHGRGVAHGALRPEVMRLGTFGRVWVTGWGTALALPGGPEDVQAALRVPLQQAPKQRAPELERGRPPSERTDVWGLGKVLRGILRACADDASLGPLRAVANKACEAPPNRRYRTVKELRQEVQRFLDGERVLAADESLLQAARRQARKHPAQAAAVVVAALVGFGLVAWTSVRVHSSWTLATSAMRETETQRRASAQRLEEAQAAAEQAAEEQRRAVEHLEFSRALDRALRVANTSLALGRAPESAEARAHNAQRNAEVLAAFAEAERLARDLPDAEPWRRLLATRGEWALRRSLAPPELRQALEDFRAWSELDPAAAPAQLGRFVAARRLPTLADAAEEEQALLALSRLQGTWAGLARIALSLRDAEAARDDGEQPRASELGEAALVDLAQLVGQAPELQTEALTYELRGRAHQAIAGAQRGGDGKGLRDFDLAAQLDPRSPMPPRLLLRFWNQRYGLHLSWAQVSRNWCGDLLQVAEYTERPEPLVELAAYLQNVQRCAASLSLLQRAFTRRRPDGRQEGVFWQRAELLRLRAELAAGVEVTDFQPQWELLPQELHAQAAFLHAHRKLITDHPRAFVRLLERGLDALRTSGQLELAHAFGDLFNVLSDRRGPNLLPLLAQILPPAQRMEDAPPSPDLVAINMARLRWLTLTPGAPAEEVQAHLGWLSRRMDAVPAGVRGRLQGIFLTSQARWLLNQRRLDPGPTHLALLDAWAYVNIGDDFRGSAPVARRLLEARLKSIGRAKLAAGLADVDPQRELWVRRWWVPREIYAEDTWGAQ